MDTDRGIQLNHRQQIHNQFISGIKETVEESSPAPIHSRTEARLAKVPSKVRFQVPEAANPGGSRNHGNHDSDEEVKSYNFVHPTTGEAMVYKDPEEDMVPSTSNGNHGNHGNQEFMVPSRTLAVVPEEGAKNAPGRALNAVTEEEEKEMEEKREERKKMAGAELEGLLKRLSKAMPV